MIDENSTKPKAPYLPYSTFKKFIAGFKTAVPSRVDKTLMNGYSGSVQSWLVGALRFFNLIDANGTPADELEQIAQGDEDTRKKVWREVFSRAYAPILDGLDLKRATLGQLYERFGEEFSVETKKKCQSFFSAGAEDAGIELSPQLKPNARTGGARRSRKPRGAQGGQEQNGGSAHAAGTPQQGNHTISAGHISATLHLTEDGSRKITVHSPPTITQAELDRLTKWLGVQLLIKEK